MYRICNFVADIDFMARRSITHKSLDTVNDPNNPEHKNHLKEIMQALEVRLMHSC